MCFLIICVLIILFVIQDVERDITTKYIPIKLTKCFVPSAQSDPTVTERMLRHALTVLKEKQHPMKEAQAT